MKHLAQLTAVSTKSASVTAVSAKSASHACAAQPSARSLSRAPVSSRPTHAHARALHIATCRPSSPTGGSNGRRFLPVGLATHFLDWNKRRDCSVLEDVRLEHVPAHGRDCLASFHRPAEKESMLNLHCTHQQQKIVRLCKKKKHIKSKASWRLAPQANLGCFGWVRDVRNHPASGLTGCLYTSTTARGVCSRCPEATFPGDGKVALDSLICYVLGRRQRAEDHRVAHHDHVRGRRLCCRSTAL